MKQNSQQTRTYQKVSNIKKKTLMNMVFLMGYKIKHVISNLIPYRQAAKQLNIKYAAAKTIIVCHRNNVMKQKLEFKSPQECKIVSINFKKCKITIITRVGGDDVSQNSFEYSQTEGV
ncbi:unnamed protein product (macronuclear) [Paramecium tetraurelia]|uniref:Uncharacterized protein n=1 Tax=Paramecium tetraurelia TaxID=5888 RepID=A0BY29_PARTE|nr:uncharacterized protein GSPATT00033299001 [Paramecium tetraurelia]CAK63446.1 unnamed protein product [Paramecium tetraurelia]|eukprot:XP_001430844.1 hypothetical protein (macronuclear) [Paramecium tetraurelia strain d4-2]